MVTVEVKITNKNGMNSRQAAELVAMANHFKSKITMVTSSESADMKSIMDVMVTVVREGESFSITIDGEDEKEAYESFTKLLNTVKF